MKGVLSKSMVPSGHSQGDDSCISSSLAWRIVGSAHKKQIATDACTKKSFCNFLPPTGVFFCFAYFLDKTIKEYLISACVFHAHQLDSNVVEIFTWV